jgi:hypothetical protein
MNEQGGSDEAVRASGPYPSTADTGPAVQDAQPADIGQKVRVWHGMLKTIQFFTRHCWACDCYNHYLQHWDAQYALAALRRAECHTLRVTTGVLPACDVHPMAGM